MEKLADLFAKGNYRMDNGGFRGVEWSFDGPFQKLNNRHGSLCSYARVTRLGVFEMASGLMTTLSGDKKIVFDHFPQEMCKAIDRACGLLAASGLSGPALLSLAIHSAEGLTFSQNSRFRGTNSLSQLRCPAVYLPDLTSPSREVLRSSFDMIWNSFGLPKCDCFPE